jgi:site-specific recombinase XerD
MNLQASVSQYLKFRQTIGKGFDSSAELVFRLYCRTMGPDTDLAEIRPEQVRSFLNGKGPLTAYWHRKHNLLVGFYRYAVSRGHVNRSPLPTLLPKRPEPFRPYLYSCADLRRLLEGTAGFQRNHVKLEAHTLRTILLLLYGAGLRVREAVRLTLSDVNLRQSTILIRQTKFHKTRLVPLGNQLVLVMAEYAARRKKDGHSRTDEAPFFVLRSGAAVGRGTLEAAFARLRNFADVHRTDGARYQPRLQDLRHTFASNRLLTWYQEGKDVQKLLPHLATYMGHVEIASTQVYLTITPELLQEASTRFERYALGEVCHG